MSSANGVASPQGTKVNAVLLRPHERRFIEVNGHTLLGQSRTHLFTALIQPDYRIYEIHARYKTYMVRRFVSTTIKEAEREFAKFVEAPPLPEPAAPETEVALIPPLVLQLVVRGEAVPLVKAALAAIQSVAGTNLRNTVLSDTERGKHAAIKVMMAELLEQIERHQIKAKHGDDVLKHGKPTSIPNS